MSATKVKPSLKKNVVLNFVKTFMSIIFPLITFPYASRILGPAGVGKVNFATSIVSYFSMIATLGISGYGIREAAKRRDDKESLSQFSQEILAINTISTIVAYILLIAVTAFVPKLQSYKILIYICGISVAFTTLGMDWLYTATENFLYITVRACAFQTISLILLFLLVRNSEAYYFYAAITVFASVGSNICNFIHSKKIISLKPKHKLDLKKHLSPILVLFALSVTSSIYNMLDTTMLGFLASDQDVGIYTAATKVNRLTVSLVTSVGTVLLPRLAYAYERKHDEFQNLIQKSIDLILLMAAPACIGLFILAEPTILVLSGENYAGAVPVMQIMNPIIIALGISNFTGVQLFLTLRKEKWTLYSDIWGAAVNFVLNYILIKKYGALGAAIASVCAESVVTIVQLYLAQNYVDIIKILKSLARYVALSLIMALLVVLAIGRVYNPILKLLIGVLVGGITYFVLLVICKDRLVLEVLKNLKNRRKETASK